MLHPRRPVFLKSACVKPQTGQRRVATPFSISSAAPIPRSKSASAKPVGSCTPFSFEHASQRFTFCIFPSRICVRKTVASLHLQTSHNILQLRPVPRLKHSSYEFVEQLSRRWRCFRLLCHPRI